MRTANATRGTARRKRSTTCPPDGGYSRNAPPRARAPRHARRRPGRPRRHLRSRRRARSTPASAAACRPSRTAARSARTSRCWACSPVVRRLNVRVPRRRRGRRPPDAAHLDAGRLRHAASGSRRAASPAARATATCSASTAASARTANPVYIRLLAEMNQANNGYCAFDRNGRSRGPSHSTTAFRNAWRRSALILRGGPRAGIDAKLRALHLPPIQGGDGDLPTPQVAMHVGAADRGLARHRRQLAARLLARRRATSTGSAPTSTRASRPSTSSSASTASSAASRSCSASGRCGAATTPASCIASSAGSARTRACRCSSTTRAGARRPVPPQALPPLARGDPRRAAPRAQRRAGLELRRRQQRRRSAACAR